MPFHRGGSQHIHMARPFGFVKYFSCYFPTLLRKLGCGISYSLDSMHAEVGTTSLKK